MIKNLSKTKIITTMIRIKMKLTKENESNKIIIIMEFIVIRIKFASAKEENKLRRRISNLYLNYVSINVVSSVSKITHYHPNFFVQFFLNLEKLKTIFLTILFLFIHHCSFGISQSYSSVFSLSFFVYNCSEILWDKKKDISYFYLFLYTL